MCWADNVVGNTDEEITTHKEFWGPECEKLKLMSMQLSQGYVE